VATHGVVRLQKKNFQKLERSLPVAESPRVASK
jgi:hypothetical protein